MDQSNGEKTDEKRIWTLRELHGAKIEKRAVYSPICTPLKKPKPAAVVMCMTGEVIFDMLCEGIYIYDKSLHQKKKGERWW